ncbi:response regulator [Erythrobacter sp. SD-21]|uniref:response regulator n=1 Tax=Erythrobacter sp. SD-21 TaxID=161528 RepID=UPI000153FA6C|nr:response regulator [Erythrobacter sp. SD-21]EDL48790.1 response regulator receiver (CheY-like protein) [Erythrobacter sp. SD-21]
MHSSDAVILVVEDEILIRMDVVDQLTGLGYSVIEASTGCEALETLTTGDGVCILFTNVDMRGDLDGIMLAHEVCRTRPEIGIIVTSGKTALGEDALPEGSRFYSKPYMRATVHAAIQEMLP